MNRRTLIALWLFVVYLATTGCAAFAPLACRCATGGTLHLCGHGTCACRHRQALRTAPTADGALRAPCCNDRHSTEIDLYTSGDPDREDLNLRCRITDLPDGLAAECPCPAHVPALRRSAPLEPVPLPPNPAPRLRGLRAPPVLA